MKCLVVDDSRMARMVLKQIILEAHPDWDIIEASDGKEAISIAVDQHPDIVLLDYNMPIMEGGEAAMVLRPMLPNAKMAFITANVQHATKKQASDLNVDFISKPITPGKILQYVG